MKRDPPGPNCSVYSPASDVGVPTKDAMTWMFAARRVGHVAHSCSCPFPASCSPISAGYKAQREAYLDG